jgi:hypothetical protein
MFNPEMMRMAQEMASKMTPEQARTTLSLQPTSPFSAPAGCHSADVPL